MRRRYKKGEMTRTRAGKQIERRPGMIQKRSENYFLVTSEKDSHAKYAVVFQKPRWRCYCKDNFFRNLICKHIQAVWARRRRLKRDRQRRRILRERLNDPGRLGSLVTP